MKQVTLLFFLIFMLKNTNAQDLYSIQLIDSIPIHFNYATNVINNWKEVLPRLKQLSLLKEGHLEVNAYTDSVGTIDYNTELGDRRLAVVMKDVQSRVHRNIVIYSNNRNEDRKNQPIQINDTLFRRADVLVYEKRLNIEFNKPYPIPINFDGDKSFLRPESKVVINKLIDVLIKYPDLKIELHGHTSGSPDNYPLSLNRALSVQKYMIESGIAEGRVKSLGFGNKKKLYPEFRADNNPLNRRVEILFIENAE